MSRSVSTADNVAGLRRMYDKFESQIRGLRSASDFKLIWNLTYSIFCRISCPGAKAHREQGLR